MSDFFVTSVENEVHDFAERPVSPGFEFFVEQGGGAADLRTGNVHAAEFGGDGGDFSGRDALNVHFGDGEFEGPLAAFEDRREEFNAARLRHLEL